MTDEISKLVGDYAGLGLPGILLRAGISVSTALGIHHIIGFRISTPNRSYRN